MDGPRPSSSQAPSIWYAAVADAPEEVLGHGAGPLIGDGVSCTVVRSAGRDA